MFEGVLTDSRFFCFAGVFLTAFLAEVVATIGVVTMGLLAGVPPFAASSLTTLGVLAGVFFSFLGVTISSSSKLAAARLLFGDTISDHGVGSEVTRALHDLEPCARA